MNVLAPRANPAPRRRSRAWRIASAALFSCALACPPASGDGPAPAPPTAPDPVAKIAGPATVGPGDLVVLDSAGSVGDGFAWARVDSDGGYLAVDGGTRCVFSIGKPGTYTFVGFSVRAIVPPKVAVTRFTLTVTGPVAPAPDPTRPVDPAPVVPTPTPPPSGLGLAEFTRETLAAAGWADDQARPGATTLSAIFANQAAKAKSYASAQAMSSDTSKVAHAALAPAAYAAWYAKVLGPVMARVVELSRAGKVATVDDLAAAYREISAALGSF